MIVRLVTRGRPPEIRALSANAFIWIVELTIRALLAGLRLYVFTLVASVAPFHLPRSLATGCLAYVLIDFLYYWKHRLYHQTRLGWAFHSAHHSSEELTAMSTFRISWVEAPFSYFFFAPLALAGFDPVMLFFLIELNDVSQIWCHTEVVGALQWLDPWLNTPQNHGRHHARDRFTADGNYGATFMIWDRLFGTFRSGGYRGPYGIEGAPSSANPFRIQLGPIVDWLFARRSETETTSTPAAEKI
jgi:sterol desaturase/sphingolipid hydroxylase (fatty acid hydroxylase superfamily)